MMFVVFVMMEHLMIPIKLFIVMAVISLCIKVFLFPHSFIVELIINDCCRLLWYSINSRVAMVLSKM